MEIDKSAGEVIDNGIETYIKNLINKSKALEPPEDVRANDIGKVIEKLCILHCKVAHLQDELAKAEWHDNKAILNRQIFVYLNIQRPEYIKAINEMMDQAVLKGIK